MRVKNHCSTYKNSTSNYIYFDAEDYDYYDYYYSVSVAKLMSPRINGDVDQCLGFWYILVFTVLFKHAIPDG